MLARFAAGFFPETFFRTVVVAGCFAVRVFFAAFAGVFFLGAFLTAFFAIRVSQHFPNTTMNQVSPLTTTCAVDAGR
jgi:hypothetical protein